MEVLGVLREEVGSSLIDGFRQGSLDVVPACFHDDTPSVRILQCLSISTTSATVGR